MRLSLSLLAALSLAVLATAACDTIPIGSDRTDGAVQTTATSTCTVNSDCIVVINYCPATCGACEPGAAAAPVSKCQPPPNVRCVDPCPATVATCQLGRCVLQ